MKPPEAAADRVAAIDWPAVAAALDERGYATAAGLLTAAECRELATLYSDEGAFRRRVVMQHHAYGRGEYQYFRYPLPGLVEALRRAIYPHLAPLANRWLQRLGQEDRYPATLDAYLAECHRAGQERPTPLILKYGADDYNCLHQDLYGPLAFPLQLTVLLSDPRRDFTGGEFLLVEQRPRLQSRGEVVPLSQGEAVIFPVHHRPVDGARGAYRATMRHGVSRLSQGEAVIFPVHHRPVDGARGAYRATMRHGVSRIHSGERYTLGVIFHDAA